MVSEGVDIPRLRVGVYATAAKTALIFRQIVGRFVRTIPGREPEPSWLYIPADTILRDHASSVETELRISCARAMARTSVSSRRSSGARRRRGRCSTSSRSAQTSRRR